MKKFILLTLFFFILSFVFAHDIRESAPAITECWQIGDKEIEATFVFHRNEEIFLQNSQKVISSYHLNEFSSTDKHYLKSRINHIDQLNQNHHHHYYSWSNSFSFYIIAIAYLLFIGILFFLTIKWLRINKLAFSLGMLTILFIIYGFKSRVFSPLMTDPLFIDAAFEPHQHRVNTRWDNTWFYVESRGIPDHPMMVGITAWQQQVPVPFCYTGTNSWQIPLNPVIASNPIPVNQMHFLRGAIALACNGIPIFNPYTNTGIDALKDGQLDIYGGHSGRADDYHYHIAPLHLEDSMKHLPIAFSLDGFPIYGNKEPDGSNMLALDDFHGHFDKDGMYHYHGTVEFPYMIAKMKGQVTEDADFQLIPQPRTRGVRPALTPLSGATITKFENNPNGNGYILTYERNGLQYKIDYSWTMEGKFTYLFISPTDTVTQVYNGTPPCELSTSVEELISNHKILVYPNPSFQEINIEIPNTIEIIKMNLIEQNGSFIRTFDKKLRRIEIKDLKSGIYYLHIETLYNTITKKLIIHSL